MKKRSILTLLLATFFPILASVTYAHEKVKLTGYIVDVMCASDHSKDSVEDAMKFAAEHDKSCGLMEACVKSGYGIFADGKWYPFDAKGSEMAKAIFEKTTKKDHIKVTVEGMKHAGQILVEKLTEEQ